MNLLILGRREIGVPQQHHHRHQAAARSQRTAMELGARRGRNRANRDANQSQKETFRAHRA
jgi:hypothetical protein